MRQFKTTTLRIIFGALLAGTAVPAAGQACGCGGAPLLGSLGGVGPLAGNWQVDGQYEYNDISGLASGIEALPYDGRHQLSQSGIARVTYGLSRSLTVSAIMTAIMKTRVVSDTVVTAGIGDGILLLQMNLLPELGYPQRDVILGLGFKAPLGSTELSAEGVRYSPDMQPTSGAWDLLGTFYATTDIFSPRQAKLFGSASYRLTRANPAFSPTDQDYRFGNETLLSIGASYGMGPRAVASFQLNVRHTDPDRLGRQTQPNTGGVWLFAAPGFSFNVTPDVNLALSGQMPLRHWLNGAIQLTTKFSFALSIHYAFSGRKNRLPGQIGAGS